MFISFTQTCPSRKQNEPGKQLLSPHKLKDQRNISIMQNESHYNKLFLLPVVQKLVQETRLFSPAYNTEINLLSKESSRNLKGLCTSIKNYAQTNRINSLSKPTKMLSHKSLKISKFGCCRKHSVITSKINEDIKPMIKLSQDFEIPIKQTFFNCYEAIRELKTDLAEYELQEIKNYNKIYYAGHLESKLLKLNQKAPNYSWDNKLGYYKAKERDHIKYRYEILSILGYGSQAIVYKCIDHKMQNQVALKVYRNAKLYKSVSQEAVLLHLLNASSSDHNIVQIYSSFEFRGHLIIVEELLGPNLFDIIRQSKFQGFELELIKMIGTQLLDSLRFLKSEGIIHGDIKPENILLKFPKKSIIRLIDFGKSCYIYHNGNLKNTHFDRYYKAPEAILGLDITEAADIWNMACILIELFNGYPLFNGLTDGDNLALLTQIKGVPPQSYLIKCPYAHKYFDNNLQPYYLVNSSERRVPGSKPLSDLVKCTDANFIKFLDRCLEWEPEKRLSSMEASRHPWLKQS